MTISVTENLPIYFNNSDSTIVFEDGKSVAEEEAIDLFRIPRVINYVPNDKVNSFIKDMGKVKRDILGKISDIEYVPNEYDKDRFLLYMDDGNKMANGYAISTNCFSEEEILNFRKFLFEKFDLETSMFKNHVLYIKAASAKKFKSLILPYMHKSMLYKLH